MNIQLLVTVQVDQDLDKKFSRKQLRDTAREAISNALNEGANVGFSHLLANDVSIGVLSVDIFPKH